MLLLVLAVLAATALSLYASTGHLAFFDRPVADALQSVPGASPAEQLADLLALEPLNWLIPLAACAVALRSGRRWQVLLLMLVLAARATNPLLKEIIERDRPAPVDLEIREPAGGYGYPSGHAMTAVLVYGYAMYVAVQNVPRAVAAAVCALGAAAIALVCWDRVYDGAHWPSDVLGGILIASTLLALAVIVADRVAARSLRHRRVDNPEASA